MNYEGCVSSVDTILWMFELDNAITVYMGHLAVHNPELKIPEIGSKVQIYNAYFEINKHYDLKKLFLCKKSRINIHDSHNTKNTKKDDILKIIQNYNLSVSDLLQIDNNNLSVVQDLKKNLIRELPGQIMLEVIRTIAEDNIHKQNHNNCFSKSLPMFTLKTISSCRYIDADVTKLNEGPSWSFGTHSKILPSDILIGYLAVNKKYGVSCMYDGKHSMPCLITNKNKNVDKNCVLNKIVLVKEYRTFTESYKEAEAPNSEYILFDVQDVLVLNLEPINLPMQKKISTEFPVDCSYKYDFEFTLLRKASVNVNDSIECWLEGLIRSDNSNLHPAYLGLNLHQIEITPFLQEGKVYHVYHNEKLKDWKNFDLLRIKSHPISNIFTEKSPIFIHARNKKCDKELINPILNVPQAIAKMKESDNYYISFQGLLSVKKLTPKLSSRTQTSRKCVGFGTPGSYTHTLLFTDDTSNHTILLYLNNWESLLIPLGLILDMRICVRNVLPQKNKYLKASAMTTFEVLGYEPKVLFDTVNINTDAARGCDKYTFLGLGNQIPCSVLVWAPITELYLRSLKLICKCEVCDVKSIDCTCEGTECTLITTITLFVHDEKGGALIISKSLELLRLLLGLELKQWKVWCKAFESIGEYVYNSQENTFLSQETNKNAFYTALVMSIKILNNIIISNLDLMCRKMEVDIDDIDGLPKWFCVDARKREEDQLIAV